MNRAHTPYDEEYGPKASCDCCGKYRPLTFSVSFGIDTWACESCRNVGAPSTPIDPLPFWEEEIPSREQLIREKAKDDADSRDEEDVV